MEAKTEQEIELVGVAKPAHSIAIVPGDFEEAWRFADMISKSDLAPKDYRGKPTNCMCAIIMGLEVGLSPMQAVQNIAVINGKPSLYGDAMLAVVQAHPAYESISEHIDEATMTASCTVKRQGEEPHTSTFSQEDAKKAGLWGKTGPWTQYPKVMLKWRARGFALRDKFADALRGLNSREEQQDIVDITNLASHTPPAPTPDIPETSPSSDSLEGNQAESRSNEDGEAPFSLPLAELQQRMQKAAKIGPDALDDEHNRIKKEFQGKGTDEEWEGLKAEYDRLWDGDGA